MAELTPTTPPAEALQEKPGQPFTLSRRALLVAPIVLGLGLRSRAATAQEPTPTPSGFEDIVVERVEVDRCSGETFPEGEGPTPMPDVVPTATDNELRYVQNQTPERDKEGNR